MTEYLVYRHGSNAANQGMTPKKTVAIVTAANRSAACDLAEATHTRYANQYFTAVPRSRASANDWDEVVDGGSLVEGEPNIVFCRRTARLAARAGTTQNRPPGLDNVHRPAHLLGMSPR